MGVGYCQGRKAVKKRLSSGSKGLCMEVEIYIQISRKNLFVAAGQRAVVKRKPLRGFSIAVAATAQGLKWLHEITKLDGVLKQPRP